MLFDVEGEQVGTTPATLTCLPGAIRLCAPDRGKAASG
jgi:diacylglycerol kinase family enzyme